MNTTPLTAYRQAAAVAAWSVLYSVVAGHPLLFSSHQCGSDYPATDVGVASVPSATEAQPHSDDEPQNEAALHPRGVLVALHKADAPTPSVYTIWTKPAFTLCEGSLSPQLPEGPFRIRFQTLMDWRESVPVTFGAFVRGHLTLSVADEVVWEVTDEQGTEQRWAPRSVNPQPGLVSVELDYRSPSDLPARLQLWWQSAEFAPEPIPAWLYRLPEPIPGVYAEGKLYELGRQWVERFACARCHQGVWRAVDEEYRPGPVLHAQERRWNRSWLLRWLESPTALRPHSTMPALFPPDRVGFIERWIIANYLVGEHAAEDAPSTMGDHRMGRRLFVSVGCAACHFMPDQPSEAQIDVGQKPLTYVQDRWSADSLTAFLREPSRWYPDGRMPSLRLSDKEAADIAAFLLFTSSGSAMADVPPPTEHELRQVITQYDATDIMDAARKIFQAKRCQACHAGITEERVAAVPLPTSWSWGQGCVQGVRGPRFVFSQESQDALRAFLWRGQAELHRSPFLQRQSQFVKLGCLRCHQRDTDEPPPIEQTGAMLGGAWLQRIPYQRTPRLTYPLQRLERAYLTTAVREGVSGVRQAEYTYRMPTYGEAAHSVVLTLIEADGEWPAPPRATVQEAVDPTAGTLYGPELIGGQGYSCISCHVWKGRLMADPDPGAMGPDLVRTVGRVRREWWDRMLENPLRLCPRTPMPAVFPRGARALVGSVLDGDAQRQKDAVWAYLALGNDAPDPQPPAPWLVEAPAPGAPVRVAQIPLQISQRQFLESLTLWDSHGRVFVVDVARGGLVGIYHDAAVYRHVLGRRRNFTLAAPAARALVIPPEEAVWWLESPGHELQPPHEVRFRSFDRLTNGFRMKAELAWKTCRMSVDYTLSVEERNGVGGMQEVWRIDWMGDALPAGTRLHMFRPYQALSEHAKAGSVVVGRDASVAVRSQVVRQESLGVEEVMEGKLIFSLSPHKELRCTLRSDLEASSRPPVVSRPFMPDPGRPTGPLSRPGYRAVPLEVPKTPWGEDAVMPCAVAVTPQSGRVFVASMKMGELWEVIPPLSPDGDVSWRDYAHGLFQEAYSMTAVEEALYVLHRRNLTAVRDTDGDGFADRFDRVAALPHGVADTYDYGYGLVREKGGSFVFAFAPYANRHIPGSGGAVRYDPVTQQFTEIAFGMRNPVGWCADAAGNIYFTDNQGEWVATNKLCRVVEGCYYGFPNPDQLHHRQKPFGRTTVWIPYGWAHSINGVTCDTTGGKFGPFAGQLFMAELMFGGAIIRADIEVVHGQAQGACFPFWGKGLLGPLALAFHPSGSLFVASITEPGWMAQPDRGGLFRIDFTGDIPFEMQTIRIVHDGFRLIFTRPVDEQTALRPDSYVVESYRYEYTGAYGSPELDRLRVQVQEAEVSEDGQEVLLRLGPLVADRVYVIHAQGVRSSQGEPLVHPAGAYTVQAIPSAP